MNALLLVTVLNELAVFTAMSLLFLDFLPISAASPWIVVTVPIAVAIILLSSMLRYFRPAVEAFARPVVWTAACSILAWCLFLSGAH